MLGAHTGARGEANFRHHDFLDRAWDFGAGLRLEQKRQSLFTHLNLLPDARGYRLGFGGRIENSDIQGLATSRQQLGATRSRATCSACAARPVIPPPDRASAFRRITCSAPVAVRLFILAALSLPAWADAPPPSLQLPSGSELQLFVENDKLWRTDRYYTNGIKLGGGVPFDLLQIPAAEVLRALDPDRGEAIHVGLFIGQNMYTPRDITLAVAQPDDRPWAAWLYLGGVAQRVRGNRLDTVELDVGMVGPAALGEPVQKAWHRLVDTRTPQGWQNQIPNEPAFVMTYVQKRRFGNDHADVIVNGGGSLGTVLTDARAGVMLRLGQRLTGFGPDIIEPGGAMLNGTRAVGESNFAGISWAVFAGVNHRYVAHNIFLDGPVFRSGPSVDRRPHVRDLSLGFSLRVDKLRFSWTRVARSAEFNSGSGGGGTQRFDSLNLGIEF